MVTQFEIDRALMAGRAYQTNRDQSANWFPVPAGWTEFSHVPNTTYPTTSGFEASAFQKGSEIVISYAGTNPSDLPGDMAANFGLATGAGSIQLQQAAEYYLEAEMGGRQKWGHSPFLSSLAADGGARCLPPTTVADICRCIVQAAVSVG